MKKKSQKSFLSKFVALEIMTLIVLGGLYIVQANKIAQLSYFIPSLEEELTKIDSSNQEMEMIVSAHNSNTDVNNLATAMNFEKIEKIEYIGSGAKKLVADKN
jgi:hypothetical protein